jgi:hypothetical protein
MPKAGRRKQRADVLEDAPRLDGDIAVDEVAGRGVHGDLSGDEQQIAGAQRRRVGTDGGGSARCDDGLLHDDREDSRGENRGSARTLCRLDDLIGPETPGADAHALGSAIDDGANVLQIRLETPRTDVMRVTHLAADNRLLAANLTMLGHDSAFLGCPRATAQGETMSIVAD